MAMGTYGLDAGYGPANLGGGMMEGELGFALATFDAKPYGLEYLPLEAKEELERLLCREQDGGWAFGRRIRDNTCGWFPAVYWAKADDLEKLDAYQCLVGEFATPEKLIMGNSPEVAQPTGHRYSRGFLLHIGLTLLHCQPVPPDGLRIGMSGRPQEEAPRGNTLAAAHSRLPEGSRQGPTAPAQAAQQRPEELVSKLVELAGGRVKIGNLAAAALALGIMSGGHGKVCQEILAAVRGRQDIFGPIPPDTAEVSKLTVSLRD